MALSLPILSPMEGEIGNMIKKHSIGIHYSGGLSLYNAIESLIMNQNKQKKLSNNSNDLYKKKFEFKEVYDKLVFRLEFLANKNY